MNRVVQNYDAKTSPLPHQLEAINYIHNNSIVALFDEQGLGKTKIVIDALALDMREEKIQGVLVISPMSLLFNWEHEVQKHSFLLPIVLKGSNREKRYRYLTGANFYIINYESVISELQRVKRFCKSRKVAVVLDESTRIKDPDSKTAQSIFQLSEYSAKRIIISGTPIANKPYDIWSQFYFLDRGGLLSDNFKKFKSKFNIKNIDYEKNLTELYECINKNSIRRLKGDVLHLPEKEYANIFVELSGKQFELYDKLCNELRIEITNVQGEIVFDESEAILKKLLRLAQIASNPFLIDKSYDETPVKFIALDELVNSIIAQKEKVVIWTCFVDNIQLLKKRYKQYLPLVIYGEIPIKERAEYVKKFQNAEDNKIMILNPSAAREGITLTSANNAIYLDRNFNMVDYLQSQDRIHRISQEKICKIYKLIGKKTIDEYIEKYIEVKKDIAEFVQGDVKDIDDQVFQFFRDKSQILRALGG
jgi:SNF2 family DNA or RNA helicase